MLDTSHSHHFGYVAEIALMLFSIYYTEDSFSLRTNIGNTYVNAVIPTVVSQIVGIALFDLLRFHNTYDHNTILGSIGATLFCVISVQKKRL